MYNVIRLQAHDISIKTLVEIIDRSDSFYLQILLGQMIIWTGSKK